MEKITGQFSPRVGCHLSRHIRFTPQRLLHRGSFQVWKTTKFPDGKNSLFQRSLRSLGLTADECRVRGDHGHLERGGWAEKQKIVSEREREIEREGEREEMLERRGTEFPGLKGYPVWNNRRTKECMSCLVFQRYSRPEEPLVSTAAQLDTRIARATRQRQTRNPVSPEIHRIFSSFGVKSPAL